MEECNKNIMGHTAKLITFYESVLLQRASLLLFIVKINVWLYNLPSYFDGMIEGLGAGQML